MSVPILTVRIGLGLGLGLGSGLQLETVSGWIGHTLAMADTVMVSRFRFRGSLYSRNTSENVMESTCF